MTKLDGEVKQNSGVPKHLGDTKLQNLWEAAPAEVQDHGLRLEGMG